MDHLEIGRRGPPDVQGDACTVLVALGAADGDAGGPVVTELDIGPPEGGSQPQQPSTTFERDDPTDHLLTLGTGLR